MISRRDLIKTGGLVAAGAFMPDIAFAQDNKVKLLLVRETGYQNKCVPCIPGKLYGVPAAIDLATAEQILGLLTPIVDTVELSYEPDSTTPSSIPEATYGAFVRTDGTKKWMWTGNAIGSGTVDLDKAWRLELTGTGHQSNIQFHYGRDAGWSRGCVIIGHKLAQCPAKGPCVFPDSPVSAVRALRNYVELTGTSSATPIQVRIASA